MPQLSIGIIGLPNVGKSTLFKILTAQPVAIANYPFCTINPNVGVVPAPDARLEQLAALSRSAKKIPAVVEFYDIAGLVRGANQGEGLGNQFLAHIRETQAVVIVLRCFPQEDIIHVEQSVDPVRDLEIIETELALKDLETVTKRLTGLQSDVHSGKKAAVQESNFLRQIKERLERGESVADFSPEPAVKSLQLLSMKERLYLLNGDQGDISEELRAALRRRGGSVVAADLKTAIAVPELTVAAYAALGLITFFTTGETETRAWTIVRGATAPQAAGVIHSDFENKFIRAEAISNEKLIEAGSWAAAKTKGWIRLEGRDYVVRDGDVLFIRHG